MTAAPVGTEIAPSLVRDQLLKIVAHSIFSDSQRMVRFLRFAVEETLRGHAAQLKENVIGTHVFDRHADYDPRIDPIVRVEARRLRIKLRNYYSGIGQQDNLVIELPIGQYAPVFRLRSSDGELRLGKHEKSIAILPFVNLSKEEDGDFLGDGLTEELINALTRVPDLRVAAWNSAAQMKGKESDLEAIREKLSVAYLLRGSIRRTTNRLRITAQLISTSDSRYVWSRTYDREFHDIIEIQESIATAIVSALTLTFWQGGAPKTTRSVESYQMCLRGRYHSRERTGDGLRRSIVCFEQAIAVDPASASAYAGLADSYTLMADYGISDAPACMEKAKAAARHALELDPASAEAHASLGLILTIYDWSWREASNAFVTSLKLNPGYASAHHWYGIDHLAMLGRFDHARDELEIAMQLDPLSGIIREGLGAINTLSRKYDEAIEIFKELLTLDPSFYKAYSSLGRAYLQKHRFREAIENLEKALSLAGEVPNVLGAVGQAYGLSGDHARARAVLAKLKDASLRRPVPSTCFALIHLGLGQKDAALDWLERAADRRETPIIAIKVHPAYDDLREEPRFGALLQRLGF